MKIESMEVTLVDFMGNDDTVVNAARVSFAKLAENYTTEQNEKLIAYLAKENHWSPFAHPHLMLHLKVPIFVARQLGKHQVGFVWNEISRRYVDYEPSFWFPEEKRWRKKATNKKQGSSDTEFVDDFYLSAVSLVDNALLLYSKMINSMVAPELARIVLPQNMMTEFYWTGSLYGFARVCNERLASGAQKEAGFVAKDILEILEEKFPVSTKYLMKDYNKGEEKIGN